MPHEIFISYSNRDQPIANAVCAVLEKKGISCWISSRDIPPGADWVVELDNAIEECRMVLFLLSSQSNKSIHVQSELMLAAFTYHRDIVSLRIEDVEPSKQIRYPLSTHQRVNAFPPPLTDYLEKLATDLQLRLIKLKSNSPEVSILSPGAGESWKPGMRYEIRWEVHAASDRTVERLKLSLCQGSREIRILADSAAGFPAAVSDFAWDVPDDMPPGEDYQLRLEIADDKSQPGSALVDFSLQSIAAVTADSQKSPVVSQETSETSREAITPKERFLMAETRSNSQLPAVKPDTAEPTDGWKILPLGPRIVCVWTLCFVFLGGLLGALHGGFSRWKETSPPRPTVEDFAKRLVDEKENSSNDIAMRSLFPATNPRSSIETKPLLQPPLGATYAIEAAEETEPEETGIVSSIQKFMTRIESCIARAFFGIPVGALFGLVIGAFVGILWWIILAIVARVTRRPIEMVYDDWGSSYRAEENQRRLEKILGNDRGLKSEGS